MLKRISALLMVMVIMALMVAPVFAAQDEVELPDGTKVYYDYSDQEDEANGYVIPIETKNTGKQVGSKYYIYVKKSTVNDIGVRMENGKIQMSGFGSGDQSQTWTTIFAKYKTFIAGISGIAAITMLVFFILNFMKLGASSGNPQQRQQALMGVLWTGLAAAGLGAVSIFFGFFYSILL